MSRNPFVNSARKRIREGSWMLICVDCAMLHANGDLTGIDSPEREAEVLAGLRQHPHLAVGDHDGFGWSSCDACGSRLGGDRFRATEVGPKNV